MRVAVVGLGRMGQAIAERLMAADHELVVYNRTATRADALVARGVKRCDALQEIWTDADVCVTMLADSEAVLDVISGEDGLLSSVPRADCVLVEMSTVSPSVSAVVAELADACGVAYLRAPVSGNPGVVAAGNLGIMASGSRDVFDRLQPLLAAIGPNLFYCGDAEQARIVKLGLNLMIAGTTELMAEALTLSEANGIHRSTMLDVMCGSAIGSAFVNYKSGPLAAHDYSSTFSTTLMHKDMVLALEAGGQAGVPLPLTAHVNQLLQACISSGLGEIDFMALLPRLQRDSGLRPDVPLSTTLRPGE